MDLECCPERGTWIPACAGMTKRPGKEVRGRETLILTFSQDGRRDKRGGEGSGRGEREGKGRGNEGEKERERGGKF